MFKKLMSCQLYLSGIWKAQCLSCHCGDLSGIFCLGSSHITNVDSKLLHLAEVSLRMRSETKLQLVSMVTLWKCGWSCKFVSQTPCWDQSVLTFL